MLLAIGAGGAAAAGYIDWLLAGRIALTLVSALAALVVWLVIVALIPRRWFFTFRDLSEAAAFSRFNVRTFADDLFDFITTRRFWRAAGVVFRPINFVTIAIFYGSLTGLVVGLIYLYGWLWS